MSEFSDVNVVHAHLNHEVTTLTERETLTELLVPSRLAAH